MGALRLSRNRLDPGRVTVVAKITCLEFTEDAGVDYLFSGPAVFYVPRGTKCTDRPALPIQPITAGKFNFD